MFSLVAEQVLAAVNVAGRARERRVRHYVHGERSDVRRPDGAPDRERRSELITAIFEVVAEQRRRQRCVDEAGGDQLDADRSEFEHY